MIDSQVSPGSQQQWFARDSTIPKWQGGVWNMVFTGVDGAPPMHCSDTNGTPSTNVPMTPIISEKPYITYDNITNKYVCCLKFYYYFFFFFFFFFFFIFFTWYSYLVHM